MGVIDNVDIVARYRILNTFTTAMMFSCADLYSGNERDPEIIGYLHAENLVPRDGMGQMLPYDIVVSMPVFPLSEGEAMEEMTHRERMKRQIIKVTLVVFMDEEGYNEYMEDGVRYTV